MSPKTGPQPVVRPTRWRVLVALAAGVGVLTWVTLHLLAQRGTPVPTLGLSAAIVVAVLAALVAGAAAVLPPRLHRRPGHKPMAPLAAARVVALAMAASRCGAALVGLYAGFGLAVRSDVPPAARGHGLAAAGVCLGAALALTIAGLVLERVCRLPPQDPTAEPTD